MWNWIDWAILHNNSTLIEFDRMRFGNCLCLSEREKHESEVTRHRCEESSILRESLSVAGQIQRAADLNQFTAFFLWIDDRQTLNRWSDAWVQFLDVHIVVSSLNQECFVSIREREREKETAAWKWSHFKSSESSQNPMCIRRDKIKGKLWHVGSMWDISPRSQIQNVPILGSPWD
jgi:hypothetical protein